MGWSTVLVILKSQRFHFLNRLNITAHTFVITSYLIMYGLTVTLEIKAVISVAEKTTLFWSKQLILQTRFAR